MSSIIALGELLLRLSPAEHHRFTHARFCEMHFGGSEANVAMTLAGLGLSTTFVTRVPNNDLGNAALRELKGMGVSIEHCLRAGDRLGIYFLEQGLSLRAGKVIYDRAGSAFSEIDTDSFNWKAIFRNANWFHWSGITPALSSSCADSCLKAVQVAKEMGLTISVDLNPRKQLWKYGQRPVDIMPELVKYCDVLLTDFNTANNYLGVDITCSDYDDDDRVIESYEKIRQKFPRLSTFATTLRYVKDHSCHELGGIIYTNNRLCRSRLYNVTHILDRMGGGDAFMSGLIYGLHRLAGAERTVEFATATAALKHTVHGDYGLSTREEIESLIDNGFTNIVR